MTKTKKNPECDKTQKTHYVAKLKNSNLTKLKNKKCDKTQNSNCDQIKKNQNVTKLKKIKL